MASGVVSGKASLLFDLSHSRQALLSIAQRMFNRASLFPPLAFAIAMVYLVVRSIL